MIKFYHLETILMYYCYTIAIITICHHDIAIQAMTHRDDDGGCTITQLCVQQENVIEEKLMNHHF